MATDTTYSPLTWMLALLDALGSGHDSDHPNVRQCPAHPDAHPSLVLDEGRDGRVLLCCRSGCTWRSVLAALTLPGRYLTQSPPVDPAGYAKAFVNVTFPKMEPAAPRRSPKARGFQLERIHDYTVTVRALRYRRGTEKEILWETRRDGCWIPGLFGKPTSELPLYRETDVKKGIALGEPVLLVESESSVDALGPWYSCTWAGGAGCPKLDRLTQVLGGYERLVVIPDNDPAGFACLARLRAAHLAPHVLMPGAGEDAREMLGRLGPARFAERITATLTATTTGRRMAS